MKVKRLLAIGGVFLALACSSVGAQTINQPNDTSTLFGTDIGQSFEATLTGEIVAISVSSRSARNANLYIYNGSAGSGTTSAVGSPIYTQAVTLNASAQGVLQRIDLTTPLPVTSGSRYTFVISGFGGLGGVNADTYANGTVVADYANQFAGLELSFAVFEQLVAPPAAATPAAIPSSSTWSLIGAGAFIMAAALFQRRRYGRQPQR